MGNLDVLLFPSLMLVQHIDLRLGGNLGVVVDPGGHDRGKVLVQVQLADHVALPLMDVDGAFVDQHSGAGMVDLTDHRLAPDLIARSSLDGFRLDGDAVAARAAQADLTRRIALAAPEVAPIGWVQLALLGQQLQHVVGVGAGAEGLARLEGQLEGGAA